MAEQPAFQVKIKRKHAIKYKTPAYNAAPVCQQPSPQPSCCFVAFVPQPVDSFAPRKDFLSSDFGTLLQKKSA